MPREQIPPNWTWENGVWRVAASGEQVLFQPPGALESGIFTSMGARSGNLIDAELHQERFQADYEWCFGIAPTVAVAELTPPDSESVWRIRVMAFNGTQGPDVKIVAVLVDWDEVMAMRTAGVGVTYSRYLREPGDLSYNHKRLGLPDKFDPVPGGDCIVINRRGEICEGSYSNVFVLTADGWITPPLDSPCLPGVGRRKLLEQREYQGREVRVGTIAADGFVPQRAFLSSSVRGIIPISSWNGHQLAVLDPVE